MKTENKKHQQETAGFVIIVLLVVIIGVIFLGIWIRAGKQKGVITESAEISNFLSSSLGYTSECYKDSSSDLKTLGELAYYCDNAGGVTCPNNADACSYLNKTYSEMLKKFKPAGILAYYRFSMYYQPDENQSENSEKKRFVEISYGSKADCSISRGGRSLLNAENGNYAAELETCDAKITI